MKRNRLLTILALVIFTFSCSDKQKKGDETVIKNEKSSNNISENDTELASKTTNVFEEKFGIHKGKRRNHISGFCFSGYLTIKDKSITTYSNSQIFSEKPLKVIGRFSHKGGVKNDESMPGEYGMAFQVTLADGTKQNFSMNTLDFFPVSTPEAFLQLMSAKVSGKKEDFDKLKTAHPEFKNFKAHYKNKPKTLKHYANQQFNSVNSFYLETENGNKTPIRWSFVPQNELISLNTSKETNFYNEMEIAILKNKALHWNMEISIANKNDKIDDAAIAWKGEHKKIIAATLTVDTITEEGSCELINFDPLYLQKGMTPSNDPILKFRSPAYAASFMRRYKEQQNTNN